MGETLSCFKKDFNTIISIYNFLSELNNIFHVKGLIRITFNFKLKTIGERPNKKNIESLDLTRKVNLLRLWRGKGWICLIRLVFDKYIKL